jgi:hypothetical protein
MQPIGPTARRLTTGLLLIASMSSVGAQAPDTPDPSDAAVSLPKGVEISCEETLKQTKNGYSCTGPVTITWKTSRIQADSLHFRDGRYVEADGNVLIVWDGNRLFGSRIVYDLEEERGLIENAMGSVLNEYLIWAKTAEKIGDKKIRVKKAVVTTCNQPVPYWAFRVSRATITIDNYARMRNVRLRLSKVPILYLPYLVWPVKDGRAAGLLFPDFGSTQNRGRVYSQELFIPLGRSADLTLLGRYFTKAGFGGGGTFRFVPNSKGSGLLRGFFIDDRVYAQTFAGNGDGRRYSTTFQQQQSFSNGFRMVADMNVISDPSFYADYSRDLNLASSPDTLVRMEFSRNGAWTSLNVREQRRERLSNGLIQQALPEVEFRGRSYRLGKTPFFLSFESSFASIQQRQETGVPIDADYLRGDVATTINVPISPTPWLDITPRVSYRWTRWTQRQLLFTDANGAPSREILDDPLDRGLVAYGVDFVGPKIFRYLDTPSTRFKHSLETQLRYGFADSFDEFEEIIRYDEVDTAQGADEQISYALVQRLFAGRPQSRPNPQQDGPQGIVLPDGTTVEDVPGRPAAPLPAERGDAPLEPLEIASFQIAQSRSFDRDLSSADVDGDGVNETSSFGPVLFTGRYNPNPRTSVDLRASWHYLYRRFSDVSVSSGYRDRLTTLRLSAVHREGLGLDFAGDPNQDDTQFRYFTAFNLLKSRSGEPKIQFSVGGTYLVQPPSDLSHFPDQQWQVRYATQCCTIHLQRLTRDIDNRRELSFRVDLTGVGKVLSQTF